MPYNSFDASFVSMTRADLSIGPDMNSFLKSAVSIVTAMATENLI